MKISKNNFSNIFLFHFLFNQVFADIQFCKNTSRSDCFYKSNFVQLEIGSNRLRDNEIWAYVVAPNPENACNRRIKVPPKDDLNSTYSWYAILNFDYQNDTECSFLEKLKNIENTGYDGVLLFYKTGMSKELVLMKQQELLNNDQRISNVTIPCLLISRNDYDLIKSKFTYEHGYLAHISEKSKKVIIKTFPVLLFFGIFIVLIGFCICLALCKRVLNI